MTVVTIKGLLQRLLVLLFGIAAKDDSQPCAGPELPVAGPAILVQTAARRPRISVDPWGKPGGDIRPASVLEVARPETPIVAEVPAAPIPAAPDTGRNPDWPEYRIVGSEWRLRTGEHTLADGLELEICLSYLGVDLVPTDRTVMVRAIIGKRHQNHEVTVTKIGGYCYLRGADRQFNIERITHASEPKTGASIGAPANWLMHRAGRLERVRPIETVGSYWRPVIPITVDVELDLSRGRGQAAEGFTVEISEVFGPGVMFEGMASRHKGEAIKGWKGRKRFAVAPDGVVSLTWLAAGGERIEDIPSWLAKLPSADGLPAADG